MQAFRPRGRGPNSATNSPPQPGPAAGSLKGFDSARAERRCGPGRRLSGRPGQLPVGQERRQDQHTSVRLRWSWRGRRSGGGGISVQGRGCRPCRLGSSGLREHVSPYGGKPGPARWPPTQPQATPPACGWAQRLPGVLSSPPADVHSITESHHTLGPARHAFRGILLRRRIVYRIHGIGPRRLTRREFPQAGQVPAAGGRTEKAAGPAPVHEGGTCLGQDSTLQGLGGCTRRGPSTFRAGSATW